MQPRTLFRTVAFAEAVTWTLLLIGLFLKYVTRTTDVGVSIAGGIHGFVFLCYAARKPRLGSCVTRFLP
jgi:integral membrane protein